VIKLADWVIDLGPEAGDAGGRVVAMGTPEAVAAAPASHTGEWLRPLLHLDRPRPIAERRHGARTAGARVAALAAGSESASG
jgi:excinuclease ABC subunit A